MEAPGAFVDRLGAVVASGLLQGMEVWWADLTTGGLVEGMAEVRWADLAAGELVERGERGCSLLVDW